MSRRIVIEGEFTADEFNRIVALIRDIDTVPGRLLTVSVITNNAEPVTMEEARSFITDALPAREGRDTTEPVMLPLNQTLDERQTHMLRHLACPDCDLQPLIPGPRAGINQNFACSCCGAEFNLARHGDVLVWAHRISPFGQPNARRLLQIYGIDL